jgi:hypothetical protein
MTGFLSAKIISEFMMLIHQNNLKNSKKKLVKNPKKLVLKIEKRSKPN